MYLPPCSLSPFFCYRDTIILIFVAFYLPILTFRSCFRHIFPHFSFVREELIHSNVIHLFSSSDAGILWRGRKLKIWENGDSLLQGWKCVGVWRVKWKWKFYTITRKKIISTINDQTNWIKIIQHWKKIPFNKQNLFDLHVSKLVPKCSKV